MYIELENKGDGVALLTINRPDALNAMNAAMLGEMAEAIDRVEHDCDASVLVITGMGRAFIAGADIAHMKDLSPAGARAWSDLGQKTVGMLASMKKPVIAAINGYALGGGTELALACDIRIASDKAVFGQPEVKLGMIAGFGGTQRLSRLIGPGLAKEMLLTGDHYDAAAALRIGLVNHVVPLDELLPYCLDMAARIAAPGSEGGPAQQEGRRPRSRARPGRGSWYLNPSCTVRCSPQRRHLVRVVERF